MSSTSASQPTDNDPSDLNQSSSPTKHHFAQAQFITTVNRDCGTNVAAAHIDQIIEEEDENEEEEKAPVEAQKQPEPEPEKQIIEIKCETTKFTLETVVLDKEQPKPTPVVNETKEDPQPDTSQPLLIGGLFTVNKINETQNDESKEDISDAIEIRVEEGYATRQMDEYFRQTIAAIKEELTKKLEKKDQNNANRRNRFDEDGCYSDSDYDIDSEDEDYLDGDSYDQDGDDAEKTKTKKLHFKLSPNFKQNNLLYHHLLNTNLNENKENKRFEQIASWFVIIGCVLNQFIIDGLCFNYANVFDLIQKDFKINSRLISSMPAALLICFYLMFAPVSIFLTKTYGTRRIALIGSFISTISLLVSSFITNIIAFTIFYGVFTGVGISLIYVPSLISVSKWFLKKRLFVNSLTILGACIGAAVYPLLSEYFIKKYTLFGALLLLSGIQANCLVGSMLLREPASPVSMLSKVKRSKRKLIEQINKNENENDNKQKSTELNIKNKSHFKKRSSSSTLLIEKDEKNNNLSNDIEMTVKNDKQKPKKNELQTRRTQPYQLNRRIDSETESTTSTSTTTMTNYTLKQYWRKFVQTRKSQANTKKNLFHLIAEEKKKTRTSSKISLEDGFVITTSNNLLAPNDESNVIISSRQAKLLQQQQQKQEQQQPVASSRTASRFFTRIANSIRSLGQSSNQSPLHTTTHSKNHLETRTTPSETVEPKLINSQLNKVLFTDKQTNDSPSAVKKVADLPSTPASTPLPLIPLMSVFSGPLPETIQQGSNQTPETDNQIPLKLANVFVNESPDQVNPVPTLSDEDVDFDQNEFDYDDDYYEENDLDDDKEIQAHKSYLRKTGNTNANVFKMSRYLSYRNSLTNSVRGSLMECSVPEDREEQDVASGDIDNSGVYDDDDENDSTLNRNNNVKRSSQHRKKMRRLQRLQEVKNSPLNTIKTTNNDTNVKNVSNNKFLTNGDARNTTLRSAPISARRFISTIEGSSFFNLPFNLETVENNIKNSFISKKSNYYRKNQLKSVYYNKDTKNTSTLFLLYLGYITNFKLFLNPLLMVLNFAFFLNIIGVCVPLIYISEFCIKQGITKTQSLYILALIGLMQGLGRIISTIIYKVNESNAKSRIFAHDLTLILAGCSVLLSTVLCDTLFSCSMFAITFGLLFGFNANLRSLFIYDIIGLEWSDDSLFCCVSLSQAIGASIGIPIAGLIYDITQNYLNVFYFSGVCLILSGVILSPGRNFRIHCKGSIKRLNKYYFQRR